MIDYLHDNMKTVDVLYENYVVQDQTYDDKTLKELEQKHNIFFLNGANGCTPIKVVPRKGRNPLIVLGYEDDGCIWFEKQFGHYRNAFDSSLIDGLITDLTAAKKFVEKLKKESNND